MIVGVLSVTAWSVLNGDTRRLVPTYKFRTASKTLPPLPDLFSRNPWQTPRKPDWENCLCSTYWSGSAWLTSVCNIKNELHTTCHDSQYVSYSFSLSIIMVSFFLYNFEAKKYVYHFSRCTVSFIFSECLANVTLYTKDFESSGFIVRMLVKTELAQKPFNPFNEVK